MDFGIFMLMQQRNKHKTSHQILRDAVEQTQLADDIGVDAALFQHARTLGGARCALGDVDDGSALVGAADAHARAFGSVPGYANPSFAEEVDAVTDPVARCRGASWSRGELVDAVRHR